jgi:DNA-binding NtrC family response regulator
MGRAGAKTWSLVSHRAEPSAPRSYVLVIGRGSCRAVELPVVGELVIGRSDAADVAIDEPTASRRHARLIIADGEIRIADLGSRNGTRVNGTAVEGAVVLARGDEIAIGEVALVVHLPARRSSSQTSDAGATRIALGDREVIVADPAMARIYELLARLARSDLAVLVCGETGVGKENAAFALHHGSPRRARPFVVVNCATIPDSLVESELFGHERGAFSGAAASKPGLLELADGGTVFLDEVGELPLAVQAKLLRAVETRTISRVGGTAPYAVDFRVVSATNRDLKAEVEGGRFRRDLLYRLNVATVELPPLRERPREIAVLARAFLDEGCRRAARPVLALSQAAVHRLATHGWPGNVRELRNAMLLAAATTVGNAVDAEHLPLTPHPGALAQPEATASVAAAYRAAASRSGAAAAPRSVAEEIEELEARRMAEALVQCNGVQVRAAERIGMPIRTFSTKAKLYGLTGHGCKT